MKMITPRLAYKSLLLFLLAGGIYVLVMIAAPMLAKTNFWSGDFETIWVTGRLFIEGKDPYLFENVINLRHEVGLPVSPTNGVQRYLPWALVLLAPLGLFDLPAARIFWLLIEIGGIVFSSELLWRRIVGRAYHNWIGLVVSFLFAPVIFALGRGQISPFMLAGIVGFLWFIDKPGRELVAGAFLPLATIKPQIPYLFLLAILAWVISRRKWEVLAGVVGSTIVLLALILPFSPSLLIQYVQARQVNYNQLDWATPTFGTWLRILLGVEHVWVYLLPPVVGIIWFGLYWKRRQGEWNWLTDTPLVLIVSIITTIFGWTVDQVIMLPAVLLVFGAFVTQGRGLFSLVITFIYLAANLAVVWLHRTHDEAWFVWFAPMFLVWFLAARWWSSRKVKEAYSVNPSTV